MTTSIRQLTAKIQAARSYAVTNRCYVAIVFPKDAATTGGKKFKKGFPCTSFRPCIVTTTDGGATGVFSSWIDGEEWHRFPVGIVIGQDSSDFTNSASVSACDIRDIIDPPLTSLESTDFSRAIIFKPDGQMTTTPAIRLAYGRYIPDTNTVVFTEREDGKVVYHPVSVNQYTGKMTVLPAIAPAP